MTLFKNPLNTADDVNTRMSVSSGELPLKKLQQKGIFGRNCVRIVELGP